MWLALAFIWGWSVVRTNCDGTMPMTPIIGYSVQVAYLDPNFYPCTLSVCCIQGQEPCQSYCSQPTTCVAYTLSAWNESNFVQQPATATETGTSVDLPAPPIGAVTFMRVVTEKTPELTSLSCQQ